jgi:hypothetical protein
LVGGLAVVVVAFTFDNSRELHGLGQGEFYALLLAVTISNMLHGTANDWPCLLALRWSPSPPT